MDFLCSLIGIIGIKCRFTVIETVRFYASLCVIFKNMNGRVSYFISIRSGFCNPIDFFSIGVGSDSFPVL